MLEEIRQQPAVLARTLSAEARHIEQFKLAIAKRRPKLIVLAARGARAAKPHSQRTGRRISAPLSSWRSTWAAPTEPFALHMS